MHCFSGDLEFARRVIDCNFHISIPGIVTYKNAHDIQDVATHMVLERMLVETDGPFLAPVPYRGKRNEPAFVREVAGCVADLGSYGYVTTDGWQRGDGDSGIWQ